MLAQGQGQLSDTRLVALQPLVLRADFGQPEFQLVRGRLDALQRFTAAPEAAATLTQLRVHLGRRRLVPHLQLTAGALEHDPQFRDQHAPELLHEPGLRQAQGLRQAEVLDIVAFDQAQVLFEAGQVGCLGQRQRKAELGVQLLERATQHVANLKAAPLCDSEQAAQMRAHADEGLFRAQAQHRRVHRGLHLQHFFAQTVARNADHHVFQHARVHPTQGLQMGGAKLEFGCLGVDPVEHAAHRDIALAAQTAQLQHLLEQLTPAFAQLARHQPLDLQAGVHQRLLQHGAALRQKLIRQGSLQCRQAAGHQRSGVMRHPRCQRLARRQREHARWLQVQRACRRCLLGIDLGGDFGRSGQRILQGVDLVEHHEAGHRMGAEVVAPDLHVRLGDAGVGPQNEHRRVRRGQQPEREFGFGPQGVEPRCVQHHQSLPEQGVRIVDERMPPGRHLHAAGIVLRRVVVGLFIVPKAEGTGFVLGHPLGSRHLMQGLRQSVWRQAVERHVRPAPALRAQLAQ